MRWVKLHADLNRDPRFLAATALARALFLQLLPELDDTGVIRAVPSLSLAATISLVVRLPEQDVQSAIDEAARLRLVVVRDDELVIPAFGARQGRARELVSASGTSGSGSRGGKTPAERAKEYRQRKRDEANGTVTAASVTANGTVTDTVTETRTVTRHGNERDANRDANVTRHGTVTDSFGEKSIENRDVAVAVTETNGTVTALDKNRIEENTSTEGAGVTRHGGDPVTAPGTWDLLESIRGTAGGSIDLGLTAEAERALLAWSKGWQRQGHQPTADLALLGRWAASTGLSGYRGPRALQAMLGRPSADGARDAAGLVTAIGLAKQWEAQRRRPTRTVVACPDKPDALTGDALAQFLARGKATLTGRKPLDAPPLSLAALEASNGK